MAVSDDDAEILAAASAGFIEEAEQMLEQCEAALLVLENDPTDSESLNAAFRAAHTIKGTAGLFGFDRVVSFTHEAETLLEALRAGRRELDEDVMAALLQGNDHIGRLLQELRDGRVDEALTAETQVLAARLRALLHGAAVDEKPPQAQAAPAAAGEAGGEDAAQAPAPAHISDAWHLSLRFGPDALRNGLDPLSFLRYLGTKGTVLGLCTLDEAVPALDELDAEACHLGFEIQLSSDCSADELRGVFDFAAEDSDLILLPPGASAADYEDILERRCGDDESARERLLVRLRALGLQFELRVVLDPYSDEALPVPAIERRQEVVSSGRDRRSGEGDRRQGGRDRRNGDETRFVRVRADKLDRLIDLIGELVIAGSGAQMVAHLESNQALLEAAQRVMDLVQETRDGALALRMVPIGETFGRFHRVVRDIAKQLGKDIELHVTGGDTELDKAMVDQVADPLMHLVRNSMDHGLETPQERLQAGKSAQGRLSLNAYHETGAVVIEVRDDGRGLSRERILNKAHERGLIDPGQPLSDHEVWQLIFLPGFSTAEQVTDLSGRGVGMDVVKRNIESLRGSIALHSEAGRGTLTQIRLPLTLAMIDGFLTMVGGVHYVVPMAAVAECIDMPPSFAQQSGRASGTFDLRGEILPWLDLARFYGVPVEDGRRRSVMVVRDGAQRVGLVVDRLLGEHQTVIKPLSGIFQHLRALAGSTILGSGDVALVLDVPGLLSSAATDRLVDAASLNVSGPAR